MNITQQKGLETELECQLRFIKMGYLVSVPIGQDSRYDMVIDIDKKLYKIQIKTSRPNDSANEGLMFSTASNRMNHTQGNIRQKYSKEDVDFFTTIYQNEMYLIPIELCTGAEKRLVKENAKFSNTTCDLMENYIAEKVIERIKNNEPLIFKKRNKKVRQYSVDGVFINEFPTFSEASRNILGNTSGAGHISDVTKGRRQVAYGFIWKVEE